jgi:hypothetical protein
MFYESCLVSNPFYGEYTLTEEDCVVSHENIRNISYKLSFDTFSTVSAGTNSLLISDTIVYSSTVYLGTYKLF